MDPWNPAVGPTCAEYLSSMKIPGRQLVIQGGGLALLDITVCLAIITR